MNLKEPTPLMKAVASVKSLMEEKEVVLFTVMDYHLLRLTGELDSLASGNISHVNTEEKIKVFLDTLAKDFCDEFREDLEDFGFEKDEIDTLVKDFRTSTYLSYEMIKGAMEHKAGQEQLN